MKMMTRRIFLALTVASALALPLSTRPASAQPAGEFFFHDGDRAMFLGDSITQQQMYSALIESYVLSRFPKWKISFRNTGWSGDTVNFKMRGSQESGFARDIAPLAPTAVTIDFGMNDARTGDKGYDAYLAGARSLADRFAALGTRVAFVTSSPEEKFEANQPAGSAYNLMLRKYSEGLQAVSAEKNALFVDQLNPMIADIEAGRAAGVLASQAGGVRLVSDNVHPNWAGHLVMATHILKGLKAPSLVSSVEIDAKSGKAQSDQAHVTDLKNGETLSFTRLDEALPMPMFKEVAVALKIPGFDPLGDLSRFTLKVTNLTASSYKLSIDDVVAATYTREELASGVNLTNVASPIKDQTDKLMAAVFDNNNSFFVRWRRVQFDAFPSWVPQETAETLRSEELKKRDAAIAAAEAKINALRIPLAHRWKLEPVK